MDSEYGLVSHLELGTRTPAPHNLRFPRYPAYLSSQQRPVTSHLNRQSRAMHYYRHISLVYRPLNPHSSAPYAYHFPRPCYPMSNLRFPSVNYHPEYKKVNGVPGSTIIYSCYRKHHDRIIGCYNCGEFNHQYFNCMFEYKVKCGSCQKLGMG